MKRFVLILISILFALSLFTGCSSPQDILSAEEIEELREEYPIHTGEPAMLSMSSIPLREFITAVKEVAHVRIKNKPIRYSVSLDGTMPAELEEKWESVGMLNTASFIDYEVEVIDSAKGVVKPGDIIVLSSSAMLENRKPRWEVGQEILVGLLEITGEDKKYAYERDFCFYVTESNYILSVFKEQKDAVYSGWKVSDFLYEMSKDKTLNTHEKPSEKETTK